jgi:Mn2+/Fe2+ NRAMP family transporter
MLIGGPTGVYLAGFALFCLWLEVFSRYDRYTAVLKWTSFTLLAYVGVALVAHVNWGEMALGTLLPRVPSGKDGIVTVVAVLGTTITPYCFFWQSSQEAENEQIDPAGHSLIDAPEEAPAEIRRMRFDTYIGMGYSNLISLFIIVGTAATLHAHGVTNIQTSSQAAEALRPIAGQFTFGLFAAGIIGIGLLAVPVLAGSGAYALGEALGWTTGLDRKPLDAAAFYLTIAISTLLGILINFIGLDPIKALFWSAVINGVVAVPLMAIIMLLAMRPDIMGRFVLPRFLWAMGWLCTLAMTVAVVVMFVTW